MLGILRILWRRLRLIRIYHLRDLFGDHGDDPANEGGGDGGDKESNECFDHGLSRFFQDVSCEFSKAHRLVVFEIKMNCDVLSPFAFCSANNGVGLL